MRIGNVIPEGYIGPDLPPAPSAGEITGARIVDWEIIPGVKLNWWLIAAFGVVVVAVMKKAKGGR